MAKKKADTPAQADAGAEAKRKQVTLDQDLFRKASVIASAMGISLPDYVNNRLRPIIESELPDVLRQLGVLKSE